ncbi:cupin domain-containing protein [Streptococcus equi]|uniref:cupin domain-containing protein n=1 Tax=Streptococcus equi TaxID=1336 RepID=UPI000F709A5F|nr:Cupin domain [Streptococcus equi subsp. equi]HEL1219136.1 cupin domain-containing protein [Streptococcus equi subsp. zooepidemicus]
MSLIHKIPTSTVIDLKAEVPIEEDQMLSRTLVQRKDLGITLFSLDKGQEIGRHSSSGDAMVNVLSGVADITIGEACYEVAADETIIMPANIPHSLFAKEAFQMLLVVVKPEA